MKTAVTVETSDRVRYLLGMKISGEPKIASREQVRAYFDVICDTEISALEKETDEMVAGVIASLSGTIQTELPIEEE